MNELKTVGKALTFGGFLCAGAALVIAVFSNDLRGATLATQSAFVLLAIGWALGGTK
jgi:hypothetical protein